MNTQMDTDQKMQTPRFSDSAHLGHVEILTPPIDASLRFFTDLVGLFEVGREGILASARKMP